MRAVQITEFGGPEVLTLVDLPEPTAAEGQVLVKVDRAGVNYADTHHAENSYLAKTTLPLVPGGEVVGRTPQGRRVVAVVGDGGYAEWAVAHESAAFDVPDAVDDVTALAMVVQGATAWLLLRKSVHLEPGESVVVHAAAGGVGSLAVQLAKAWGAGRVIATASSESKRQLALDLGADVAVDANAANMTDALREANERSSGGHRARHDRRPDHRRERGGLGAVWSAGVLRHGQPDTADGAGAGEPAGPLANRGRDVAGARGTGTRTPCGCVGGPV